MYRSMRHSSLCLSVGSLFELVFDFECYVTIETHGLIDFYRRVLSKFFLSKFIIGSKDNGLNCVIVGFKKNSSKCYHVTMTSSI